MSDAVPPDEVQALQTEVDRLRADARTAEEEARVMVGRAWGLSRSVISFGDDDSEPVPEVAEAMAEAERMQRVARRIRLKARRVGKRLAAAKARAAKRAARAVGGR